MKPDVRSIVPETIGVSESTQEHLRKASESLVALEITGYTLEKELGRGCFGTVWQATREKTGQQVAVKVVDYSQNLDWDYFRRELEFLREIEDHPHTLMILDAQLDQEPPFIVMPLATGGNLEEVVRRDAPGLDVTERWLDQIAQALAFVHKKGVIHCDLKPSNLLLSADDNIRLADLGQARRPGHEVALGTIGFMAPEQCDSTMEQRPSVSWDVYGYGATAYWLLTGKIPRMVEGRETTLAVYREAMSKEPLIPIRDLNPKVDRELAGLVEKCLELDPNKRVNSMGAVLADLGRRRRGEPLEALRPWRIGYLFRTALKHQAFQILLFSILLALMAAAYAWNRRMENKYQLYLTNGIHAHESGRMDEAYLNWLRALDYRENRPVIHDRLAYMPLAQVFPHSATVVDLELLTEGGVLISAGSDGELCKWELASGKKLAAIKHRGALSQLDSTADGEWLASAAWDGKARIFRIEDLELVDEIEHKAGDFTPSVTTLKFCGQGRYLVSADVQGNLKVYDREARKELPLKSLEKDSFARQVIADHPTQSLFAALVNSDQVGVWSLVDGDLKATFSHEGEVNDLRFSSDGVTLYSASDDGTVKCWDLASAKLREEFANGSRVNVIRTLGPNKLAAGCEDGTVNIWQAGQPEPLHQFFHRRPVRSLQKDREGSLIVVGTGEAELLWSDTEPNGTVTVWDVNEAFRIGGPWPHDGPVQTVRFLPDTHMILSASGSPRQPTAAHPGAVRAWRYFQPEALPAANSKADPRKVLNSVSVGGVTVTHGDKVDINDFAVDEPAQVLATASADRTVRLWHLENGEPAHAPLLLSGSAEAVSFDEGGERLATASFDSQSSSTVRLWEVGTSYPISPELACPGRVYALEFSPNGEVLTAHSDRGAFQWEMRPSETQKSWEESLHRRLQARLDKRGMVVAIKKLSEMVMTRELP